MSKKIYPCGSKPAAIYGLPKTNNMLFDSDDFSLRPIISLIGNLVTYDVCSLFTNIPLQEAIVIVIELILENNPQLKVTKRELKQLFDFATSGTQSIFNDSFNDQIDGVSMGSPLGPVLANLFMGYHGKEWLQEFDKGKVLMYKRYVDDIFCMFRNEKDAQIFLNFFTVSIKKKQ